MGDPRKLRNKSERPKKLWETDRIAEESGLKKDYGLKAMRELWMSTAELKKYRREARRLLSQTEDERKGDDTKILAKLARYDILKPGSKLEDVLSLTVKDVLERRLQTIVMRKGLARSMSQSRQLITHGFIAVNGVKVTRPNYLVKAADGIDYAKPIDISVKTDEAPAQARKAEDKSEAPAAHEAPNEEAAQKPAEEAPSPAS